MMSASTIEMPIVTSVWRRSWPCMKRKIVTCSSRPISADAAKPQTTASTQEPVRSPTTQPM